MISFHIKDSQKYSVVKSSETMNRIVFLSVTESHPPHCFLSAISEILIAGTIFHWICVYVCVLLWGFFR